MPGSVCGSDAKFICRDARERSDILHQVFKSNPNGFGDSDQSINAGGLLASLDFSDVNRVKIGLFRQLFLRQTRLGAVMSDRFPNNLPMI